MVLCVGCSTGEPEPPFRPMADVQRLMVSIVDPAYEQVVVDYLNGYYRPDDSHARQAMRPGQTFNAIIDAM